MSSLPVCVIVTSQTCSHCVKLRGKTGSIYPDEENAQKESSGFSLENIEKQTQPHQTERAIPGNSGKNWSWNSDFFHALLTGKISQEEEKKTHSHVATARVFEVHFMNMRADTSTALLTVFSLTGNADRPVEPTIFSFSPESKESLSFDSERKKEERAAAPPPFPLMEDFRPYIHHFPMWLFVDGKEWDRACSLRPSASSVARIEDGMRRRKGIQSGVHSSRMFAVLPYTHLKVEQVQSSRGDEEERFIVKTISPPGTEVTVDLVTRFADFCNHPQKRPSWLEKELLTILPSSCISTFRPLATPSMFLSASLGRIG